MTKKDIHGMIIRLEKNQCVVSLGKKRRYMCTERHWMVIHVPNINRNSICADCELFLNALACMFLNVYNV